MRDERPCTNCGTIEVPGQWWILNGYFGVNGYFCPTCFELVSHDPYRVPNHPKEYNAIVVKQQLTKAVSR